MLTLFSKGGYDFVMQGGPWIFNQNALIVKDLDETAQPSELVLNSVPVWVHIYDIPWGKQDKVIAMARERLWRWMCRRVRKIRSRSCAC
jgi:hypothetical protein